MVKFFDEFDRESDIQMDDEKEIDFQELVARMTKLKPNERMEKSHYRLTSALFTEAELQDRHERKFENVMK